MCTRAQAASGEQPSRFLPLTFPRQSDHLPGSIEFRAHRLGFIQPGLGTVHVPRVREVLGDLRQYRPHAMIDTIEMAAGLLILSRRNDPRVHTHAYRHSQSTLTLTVRQ